MIGGPTRGGLVRRKPQGPGNGGDQCCVGVPVGGLMFCCLEARRRAANQPCCSRIARGRTTKCGRGDVPAARRGALLGSSLLTAPRGELRSVRGAALEGGLRRLRGRGILGMISGMWSGGHGKQEFRRWARKARWTGWPRSSARLNASGCTRSHASWYRGSHPATGSWKCGWTPRKWRPSWSARSRTRAGARGMGLCPCGALTVTTGPWAAGAGRARLATQTASTGSGRGLPCVALGSQVASTCCLAGGREQRAIVVWWGEVQVKGDTGCGAHS